MSTMYTFRSLSLVSHFRTTSTSRGSPSCSIREMAGPADAFVIVTGLLVSSPNSLQREHVR